MWEPPGRRWGSVIAAKTDRPLHPKPPPWSRLTIVPWAKSENPLVRSIALLRQPRVESRCSAPISHH